MIGKNKYWNRTFVLLSLLGLNENIALGQCEDKFQFKISDYKGKAISCQGGMDGFIRIIPQDEKETFTCFWSTGSTSQTIENLSAGTYTVYLSNASGCHVQKSITLQEPKPITFSLTQYRFANGYNNPCFGRAQGTVLVETEGGTGLHQLLWSNGYKFSDATDLKAGKYHITATDENGCQSTTHFEIDQPIPIEVQIDVVSHESIAGASDGILDTRILHAFGKVEYLWSSGEREPQLKGLKPGNYSLEIKDSLGCKAESKTTIASGSSSQIVFRSLQQMR